MMTKFPSTRKKCMYPFRDGNVWCPSRNVNGNIPPTYGSMAKCGYALPDVLADSLVLAIQRSESFLTGDTFAIPLMHISCGSTFLSSSARDAMKAHAEGDGDPAYALGQVMGHLPEGNVHLVSTSVNTSTSIIVKLDLNNATVDEGLSQEQTFAKNMFHRASLLVYKTSSDASLVRHRSTPNP